MPDSAEAGGTLSCGLETLSIAGGRESEEGPDELLNGSMLFSRPQRLFPPLDAVSAAAEALMDADGDDSTTESLDVGRDGPEEEFDTAERMLSKERNIPGGGGWSFLSISRQRLGAGLHGAVDGATELCSFARSWSQRRWRQTVLSRADNVSRIALRAVSYDPYNTQMNH